MGAASLGFHKGSWHHCSGSLQLWGNGVGWIFAEQHRAGILGGDAPAFPQRFIGYIGDVRRDDTVLELEKGVRSWRPVLELSRLFLGIIQRRARDTLGYQRLVKRPAVYDLASPAVHQDRLRPHARKRGSVDKVMRFRRVRAHDDDKDRAAQKRSELDLANAETAHVAFRYVRIVSDQ